LFAKGVVGVIVILFKEKTASKGIIAPEELSNLNSTIASTFESVITSSFTKRTFSLKTIEGCIVEKIPVAEFAGKKLAVGIVVSTPLKTVPSTVKLSNLLFPTAPPGLN